MKKVSEWFASEDATKFIFVIDGVYYHLNSDNIVKYGKVIHSVEI